MSIASSILKKLGYVKRSGTYSPSSWFVDWVTDGKPNASGIAVNENTALKFTPFWAAVRIISGTVASLPFLVYKRLPSGGKERYQEHPIYKLLHDRPNEYMDALTFIETRQAHVLTYGNGYAEIQRNGAGKPVALWPLLPNKTWRKMLDDGTPYYEVRVGPGDTVILPDYNVLHIKGLGFDGYTGYDVVSYHKDSIGYGMGAKDYGSRFFANNGDPGGVLTHPDTLTNEAAARLRDSWDSIHKGLSNAHRIAVLEEGMTWTKVGVDPEQAQALEVQKYNVDDISRIFNIPPHKLGSMDRATFSNIEEQNIDFVTSTMLYWFRKWEQECQYKLFMPSEQGKYFCEILIDGLLRGNAMSRSRLYASGRQWGYYSINDIRRMENMNPIGAEGDVYLDPMNMVPAGSGPVNQLNEAPPEESDDVRLAHRDMIASQWLRIIKKIVNATGKGKNGDYFDKHRSYAQSLLFEPVNAYATTRNVPTREVSGILDGFIHQNVNPRITLRTVDADRLADEIMREIGGNNAAT